jgi:hypothetical protein
MAKLQKTKLQAMVPVREQELVWVLQLQMLLKVLQLRRLQLRRLQLRRLQPVLRLLHLQLPRLQLRRLQLRRLQPVLQLRRLRPVLQLPHLQLRRLQQLHVALRRLQLHHPPATPRRLQLFQVWQRVLQVLRLVVHIVVAMTLCSTSRCGVRHGQRHKLLRL